MDTTILLPAVTTAATVGLGCGTCCSPIISTFLSAYVVSHSNGVKKGVLSFVSFFAGKLISVITSAGKDRKAAGDGRIWTQEADDAAISA